MICRGLPLLLTLLGACGYLFHGDPDVPEVAVDMFDNLTERRHHERDLSRAVVNELMHAGIRVVPGSSMRLEGEIVDVSVPPLAESLDDEVLVGSFQVRAQVRLVDRAAGKILWERTLSASSSFTELRGKPIEAAQLEVFRALGRSIVSILEGGW